MVRTAIVITLFVVFPLLGCTISLSSASKECASVGASLGRGYTSVICTPASKTIIIPPSSKSEEPINTDLDLVWIDNEFAAPSEPIQMDEQTYKELISNVCLAQGCTIIEESETGINIKGGPPETSFITGMFDLLFKVGAWFAAKYFTGI